MKKHRIVSIILNIFFFVGLVFPAEAQTEDFAIRLRKDFGYSTGVNIRGTFSIILTGDENLVSAVEFQIDGESMVLVDEAPFRFQFHTDNFGFGIHRLKARVFLKDGTVLETAPVQYNFLNQKEERSQMVILFGGIALILLLSLVMYAFVHLVLRKPKPKQGEEDAQPEQSAKTHKQTYKNAIDDTRFIDKI